MDPVGLIARAPEDEYDPEVADLVRRGDVVADDVIEVFVRWFGDDGRLERQQAEDIARAMNNLSPDAPLVTASA